MSGPPPEFVRWLETEARIREDEDRRKEIWPRKTEQVNLARQARSNEIRDLLGLPRDYVRHCIRLAVNCRDNGRPVEIEKGPYEALRESA